jgi:hypothetical protein
MMRKCTLAVVSVAELAGLVIVLLLLSACGTSGAAAELATEADDVLGVWHRTMRYQHFDFYMQLRPDGTMGFGRSPDKWEHEWSSHDFGFEGTHFSITETAFSAFETEVELGGDISCTGYSQAPDAVYEIQLLGNGNLKFVSAQDRCQWRREVLAFAEWAPVP